MREYEATLVLSPELDDDAVNQAIEQVGDTLERAGGELTSSGQLVNRKGHVAEATDGWKQRKLSYAIDGHKEGYYLVLRFTADPPVPAELERQWKLNESVLRYLVVRADDAGKRPEVGARA